MADSLDTLLMQRFGFHGFRPGQRSLIEAALSGRDALGVLPTGGGKTLCFQVPAAARYGTVVVVSPLISLMKDQVARARKVGLRAASVTALESRGAQTATLGTLARDELDLLFLSPERLATETLRAILTKAKVSLLAVDEAHCISEWGHDFRPAFRRIAEVRSIVRAPVLAVTATATPEVRGDIESVLGLRRPRIVVTSFDRPNIAWHVEALPAGLNRVRRISALLRDRSTARGAAIVYAPTRRLVAGVRRALSTLGHTADAYHAGLDADERSKVQERFMTGETKLIVATNAFGMGIDRGDVALVVHFALPGSLESYYQEAGRAGRDGEPSQAIGFVQRGDWKVPAGFIDHSYPPATAVHRALRQLRAMKGGKSGLEGRAIIGAGGARVPAVRWLIRGGALAPNEALERAVSEWPAPPATGGDAPRGHITGRPPDLDALTAARVAARTRLQGIRRYAKGRGCRRKALLRYLGELPDWRSCGSCDRCMSRRGQPS